MRKLLLLSLLLCCVQINAYSQNKTTGRFSIEGSIVVFASKAPVEFATVTIKDFNLWSITDSKGRFKIVNIPKGDYMMVVSCLGFKQLEIPLSVDKNLTALEYQMREENLKLEEVVVTAKEIKSNINTSTKIDRTAIEHMQLLSASDLMSLVPGGKTTNPNLLDESIFSIRDGDGNGTFGTAVEVDGIRLSSNASLGSSLSGVNTRNLSASNIESIEVITGVPSVEYGDMTSGVVIINTKRGKSPYTVTATINATAKQFSLSRGLDLDNNRGIVNVNAEYARALRDPVSPYTTYNKTGLDLNYSNTLNRNGNPLSLNVSLAGTMGKQQAKTDPDAFSGTWSDRNDDGARLGVSVKWLLNKPWITGMDFAVKANYQNDKTQSNNYFSYTTIQPSVNSPVSGYYQTNYIPAQFYNLKVVDSQSLGYGASVKANLTRKYGQILNKVKAGVEWNASGNVGKGEYYVDNILPNGYRPRPYSDIPFMHNISAYLEDQATLPIGKTSLTLIGGVRLENTTVKGMQYDNATSLSPRFNGRYTIIKQNHNRAVRNLSARFGWGITEKLPSLGVLYPMDKYRDLLVYSKNYGVDNQYFYAAKTEVYRDFFNPLLRWSKSRNMELGIDANIKGVAITLVAYNNKSKDPYIMEDVCDLYIYKKTDQSYAVPSNPQFRVDNSSGNIYVKDKNNPSGAEMLIPTSVRDTMFVKNSYQSNGEPTVRKGIELSVDFGRWDAIYTSFRLDARYSYSKNISERLVAIYPSDSHSTLPSSSGRSYEFVGFYANGTSRTSTSNGSKTEGLSANLTSTTNIPALRMVVSIRLEATLLTRTQAYSSYQGRQLAFTVDENGNRTDGNIYSGGQYTSVWPVSYMGFDGVVHPFTATEAADPRFSKLIGRSSDIFTFNEDGYDPYFMANISLTKEIGNVASLSFYVNNFTKSNPFMRSWATGIKSSQNIGFSYGATLRLKF